LLQQGEMSGTADGEKLCQSLDEAQNKRWKGIDHFFLLPRPEEAAADTGG